MAALVHSTKVTHYIKPSQLHVDSFFRSVTGLYEEQAHTDLLLVAADGTTFRLHQMILASCSTFLRDAIVNSSQGCMCEDLTIYLPDFEADTVNNLLSIIYTGSSLGDCELPELKSLLKTLLIDLDKLKSTSIEDSSSQSAGGTTFPRDHAALEPPPAKKPKIAPPLKLSSISHSSTSNNSHHHSPQKESPEEDDHQTQPGNEDEMVEVVPEVQYFGNHFLASDDPEDEESGGGRGGQGGGASEMAEQSMARHNELTRQMQENGFHNPGLESNGMMDESVESGEGKAGYGCRLCGKISGNGASLFAHLLYPHYAHLWKTEIPHRIPRYDCNKCNYTTGKRQHYVMHVARVHDELRTKLAALGENLEVLDNLTQKHNTGNEIIVSTIAKGLNNTDDGGNDSISIKEEPTTSDSPVASKDTTYSADDLEYSTSQKAAMAAAMLSQYNGADLPGRFPRGFKPFVKCRLCGKSWKGKDNFFTHLVSTHFKYLWAKEVPRHAEMFICHVAECTYKSKYRYNFLFHLAGKHKQLKSKLVEEGVPLNVLKPIETDGSEFEQQQHLQQQQQQQNHNGGSSAGGSSGRGGGRNHRQSSSTAEDSYAQLAQLAAGGGLMETAEMLRQSKILMQAKQRLMTTPGSAVKGSDNGSEPATGPRGGKPSKPGTNNTRLICRVCNKVSLNHTCHRQHVVGKHFIEFWAHLTPDHMGVFNCHHPECPYKTPNRSVFIIHLAYVHQELKTKLIQSGKDPNCATPDVYGKRKYRRALYDNSIHSAPGSPALGMGAAAITIQEQLAAYLQAGAVAAAQAAAQAASMNESGSSPEPIPAPAVQEPRPQIQCRICKEAFPSMSSVTDHLAQTHFSHIWEDSTLGAYHMPRVSGQGYSCQHCPRTAPSRTSFIRHIVKQHDAMTQVLAVQFDNQKTIQDLVQLVNPEDLASAVSTAASGSSAGGPAPINSNGGGSLDDHEQDDDDVEMVQEEEEEDLEDEEDIGEDNVAVANHESW